MRQLRREPLGRRPGTPVSTTPPRGRGGDELIERLQGSAGNRAVAALLSPPGSRVPPPATNPELVLQREPASYDPGEKERATASGVLTSDVMLLAGIGSGYNAAANSVLIADFRPNSAVVRTSTAEELRRGRWLGLIEGNAPPSSPCSASPTPTGPEAGNTKLRADRARAVAALLPRVAKRGVVGPAPAADFISAGQRHRPSSVRSTGRC